MSRPIKKRKDLFLGGDRPFTVAVDLDGTVVPYFGKTGDCAYKYGDAPEPYPGAIDTLKKLKRDGAKIIVFTSRDNSDALSVLTKHNIPYDEINQNTDALYGNTGKPQFDVHIDDKVLQFDGSWRGMYRKIRGFKPHWEKSLSFVVLEKSRKKKVEAVVRAKKALAAARTNLVRKKRLGKFDEEEYYTELKKIKEMYGRIVNALTARDARMSRRRGHPYFTGMVEKSEVGNPTYGPGGKNIIRNWSLDKKPRQLKRKKLTQEEMKKFVGAGYQHIPAEAASQVRE